MTHNCVAADGLREPTMRGYDEWSKPLGLRRESSKSVTDEDDEDDEDFEVDILYP